MTGVKIHTYIFVVCVKRFGPLLELSLTRQLVARSSLYNTRNFREVGAFDKIGITEASHLVGTYISRRSRGPRAQNELEWKEISFVEWRFLESKTVDQAFENATTSRSHGSLHTMEPADVRDTARAQTYAVWEGCGGETGAV